ncbi:bifunctional helix-turn-helix transcriptional regulator/GNAT family N-acetyltransferase, partial [Nocardioides sp. NPDC006273]|uniref:bifunctional helix-turn-helix transcriptional regulator/GNAT family N-acetyltransferase n=1 Tax=Nocardioides sp. NPDC006273 TaxID=3155598 RepID=UPI00339E4395
GAETVQDLRTRLGGLDSGYVSRMLRTLESKGYVAMDRDPSDGRRRLVALTEDGLKQWDDLERRSEERAHLLLDPLTQRQRDRLNDALATADLLVRAATITIEQIDPRDPIAQMAMGHYFAEIGDRFGFTVGDEGFGDDPSLRAPHGAFFIAASDGAPVASGGVREFDGTGEIKRMWVDPAWRGAGLGSRLLRHLEAEALRLGHRVVRLDTRDVLSEAIGMYERAGYERIDRYNDNPHATHFFQKELG